MNPVCWNCKNPAMVLKDIIQTKRLTGETVKVTYVYFCEACTVYFYLEGKTVDKL
jgi:hypothetical protein